MPADTQPSPRPQPDVDAFRRTVRYLISPLPHLFEALEGAEMLGSMLDPGLPLLELSPFAALPTGPAAAPPRVEPDVEASNFPGPLASLRSRAAPASPGQRLGATPSPPPSQGEEGLDGGPVFVLRPPAEPQAPAVVTPPSRAGAQPLDPGPARPGAPRVGHEVAPSGRPGGGPGAVPSVVPGAARPAHDEPGPPGLPSSWAAETVSPALAQTRLPAPDTLPPGGGRQGSGFRAAGPEAPGLPGSASPALQLAAGMAEVSRLADEILARQAGDARTRQPDAIQSRRAGTPPGHSTGPPSRAFLAANLRLAGELPVGTPAQSVVRPADAGAEDAGSGQTLAWSPEAHGQPASPDSSFAWLAAAQAAQDPGTRPVEGLSSSFRPIPPGGAGFEGRPDAARLADLVNEALAEQARLHGVDLS